MNPRFNVAGQRNKQGGHNQGPEKSGEQRGAVRVVFNFLEGFDGLLVGSGRFHMDCLSFPDQRTAFEFSCNFFL